MCCPQRAITTNRLTEPYHESCSCTQAPCCAPCDFPYALCTMTCPPPCLAPTRPQPVKPLQLPCPQPQQASTLSSVDAERFRYDNFYNNYNIDWHSEAASSNNANKNRPQCTPERCKGQTVDGKLPCCEDYSKTDEYSLLPGCPTGFKPCTMKLKSPGACDPCGVWCAEVQPCPPKPKNKSNKYVPGPCTRPCCKHAEPKEGPCLYDDPCKAHCYNHPPGMKPSGRFP